MRIAFDAKRLFCNYTGLGNYSRTLLRNLLEYSPENEYILYTPEIRENQETTDFLNKPNISIFKSTAINKSYWRSYSITSQLMKDKIDIYHGLSNELPFNIQKAGIKSIVTIHDLIFKVYPETYPSFDRKIYDIKFRKSCQNADRIIAISQNTKNDIIRFYDINPEKIEVIPQSCNPIYFDDTVQDNSKEILHQYGLPDKYMLYVGSVEKRKNLKSIIEAYRFLAADMRIPLVVIGKGKDYLKETKCLVKERQLENLVCWVNYLEDNSHLKVIYKNAQLFIYPSFYEGFGLPVVESLLCRTPVITSNRSSLMEAGGPDSLYVDPTDPEMLAKAIMKVLSDEVLSDKMKTKGYHYAVSNFSPKLLIERMTKLYQHLYSEFV
jgi:glycosyltransferase involved in cell wall biosynthesis